MTKHEPLSRIELLQGTLDMIVLQTLRWGPRHGYGIAQMIRAGSSNALQVDTGSLYPALHRLERDGLLSSAWSTDSGRRRRVYRVTRAGASTLEVRRQEWRHFAHAVEAVMG